MSAEPAITLRPVGPDDEAFLLQLYACVRADELALTPWDGATRERFVRLQFEAQQRSYRSQYPRAEHALILRAGEPVGRLYLNRGEEELHILDVTILPEYRGAGIGTAIVRDLQREAADRGQPLSIYVESFNRSLGLFERLGFTRAEQLGIHCLMMWQPNQAGTQAGA